MKNLENYRAIADGIASLYFPHVEVSIHDVETNTVVHIANNISHRKLGEETALDKQSGNLENFTSTDWTEKPYTINGQIRSINCLLKNDNGESEALLCINLNFSALATALDALNRFLESALPPRHPEALFKSDWQDRINSFIETWLKKRNLSLLDLSRNNKCLLIEALYNDGAFEGKKTAEYLATVLTIGRTTIFNHLKAIRKNRNAPATPRIASRH